MTPLVDRLFAQAFHRAPAREANQAIAAARALCAGPEGEALSYEVLLPQFGVDEYLTTRTLPRLVSFLDCRGLSLHHTPQVFVSLFTPGGLLFVSAGPVALELGAAVGLNSDELVRRYGAHGRGDPLLLGSS